MEKETDIQLAICDYLALRMRQGKLMFWRQNTNPVFADGHYRSMPKYSMNGVPDIIVIHNGFFIGLEVKRPKGRQSESQRQFEKLCLDNGGEYHLVTSVEDLKELGL